jgi:hypothetical protein
MPYVNTTVRFSEVAAAALTADKTIYTPTQDSIVSIAVQNRVAVFAGGAVATATLSIGTDGARTNLLGATNVFTGATLGIANATVGALTIVVPAGTPIIARLTTSVANTNACTTGLAQLQFDVRPLSRAQV